MLLEWKISILQLRLCEQEHLLYARQCHNETRQKRCGDGNTNKSNGIWLFLYSLRLMSHPPLKIRLVSHTPFSLLDSVYKPLHRRDLPSCVQSPGQSSYALSFHCAGCFRLTHRQGWAFCQASISFLE